jgi:hypothetical protein
MKENKKTLLNEELNRFKKLLDYNYYDGKLNESEHKFSMDEFKGIDKDKEQLIFGSVSEADEENADATPEETPVADTEEMPVDNQELPTTDTAEMPVDNQELPATDTEELPLDNQEDLSMGTDSEEIDLDVTELVKGSKEAKESADQANFKIERLMGMVDNLEGKLNSMQQISGKIDNLEKELEKRVPTDDEKIQLRSMDSYPYNVKLSDFWSDQVNSPYDAGLNNDENKDEEGNYVLTQNDIDSDYSDSTIKKSFNENPYDEEDIN